MGAGGSSERRSSVISGGTEEAMFTHRDTQTRNTAEEVVKDGSSEEDFLDISYSEGGGILSPQDIQRSIMNKSSGNCDDMSNSLDCDGDDITTVDESDKENTTPSSRSPFPPPPLSAPSTSSEPLPPSLATTCSSTSTSMVVSERGSLRHRALQRAQTYDVPSVGPLGSSQLRQSSGGLLIERRTSERSFLSCAPEHPGSPDLSRNRDTDSSNTMHDNDLRLEEVST